jgi:hypothetical protein
VSRHRIGLAIVALSVLLVAIPAEAGSKKAKSKTSEVVQTAQPATGGSKPKATPRTRGTRKAGTPRSPKVGLPGGLRPRVSIGAGPARLTLGTGGNRGSARYRHRRYR